MSLLGDSMILSLASEEGKLAPGTNFKDCDVLGLFFATYLSHCWEKF